MNKNAYWMIEKILMGKLTGGLLIIQRLRIGMTRLDGQRTQARRDIIKARQRLTM